MKIRKFRLSDAKELAKMHRDTIRSINKKDYSPAVIKAWSNCFNSARYLEHLAEKDRFIALINNKIVGFIELCKNKELDSLFIHKNYQRRGIAKKLYTQVEVLAKKRGLKKLFLCSSLSAKTYYQQLGYRAYKYKKVKLTGTNKYLSLIMMSKQF